jgi:hypothetical protein
MLADVASGDRLGPEQHQADGAGARESYRSRRRAKSKRANRSMRQTRRTDVEAKFQMMQPSPRFRWDELARQKPQSLEKGVEGDITKVVGGTDKAIPPPPKRSSPRLPAVVSQQPQGRHNARPQKIREQEKPRVMEYAAWASRPALAASARSGGRPGENPKMFLPLSSPSPLPCGWVFLHPRRVLLFVIFAASRDDGNEIAPWLGPTRKWVAAGAVALIWAGAVDRRGQWVPHQSRPDGRCATSRHRRTA